MEYLVGTRGKTPQTLVSYAASSILVRFFREETDLLAVQAVSSEPVSAEFPVKQGKNREFSRI